MGRPPREQRAMMPTTSPMRPMTTPRPQRPDAGLDVGSIDVADRRVRRFGSAEGQRMPTRTATTIPTRNDRPIRAPLTPTAASEQATAIAMNSSTPCRTPQPIEPRQPLAQEQRGADRPPG